MGEPKTMKINEVEYVRKDSLKAVKAESVDGMDYVIVRTYSAGVHAGYQHSKKGREVVLKQSRRLWKWSGAASLSQLSVDGVKDKDNCKFPCEIDSITLTEAIEIIPCTEKARLSIKEVSTWQL